MFFKGVTLRAKFKTKTAHKIAAVPFSLRDGLDLVALGLGGQFDRAGELLLLPLDLLCLHLEQPAAEVR